VGASARAHACVGVCVSVSNFRLFEEARLGGFCWPPVHPTATEGKSKHIEPARRLVAGRTDAIAGALAALLACRTPPKGLGLARRYTALILYIYS
jgi:hypothetical protein